MSRLASRLAVTALALVLTACTTTATIHTIPPGARVYIRGTYRGKSPVKVELKDGFDNALYYARLEKEGYATDEVRLQDHYSPWIVLDAILLLPTLTLWRFVLQANGRRHQDEYWFRLRPASPPAAATSTGRRPTGLVYSAPPEVRR